MLGVLEGDVAPVNPAVSASVPIDADLFGNCFFGPRGGLAAAPPILPLGMGVSLGSAAVTQFSGAFRSFELHRKVD